MESKKIPPAHCDRQDDIMQFKAVQELTEQLNLSKEKCKLEKIEQAYVKIIKGE